MQRYDAFQVERKEALRDVKGLLPKAIEGDPDYVQSRMVSLLAGQGGVRTRNLPRPANDDPHPFEVLTVLPAR